MIWLGNIEKHPLVRELRSRVVSLEAENLHYKNLVLEKAGLRPIEELRERSAQIIRGIRDYSTLRRRTSGFDHSGPRGPQDMDVPPEEVENA